MQRILLTARGPRRKPTRLRSVSRSDSVLWPRHQLSDLLAGRLPLPHSQLRILRFQEEGLEIRLASLAQLVCQRQGRERSRGEGIIKRRLRQERSLDPQRADEGCSKEALRTLADDRHDPPRSQV